MHFIFLKTNHASTKLSNATLCDGAVVRAARMERCPSQLRLLYSLLRPALPFHEIFPTTLQKQTHNRVRLSNVYMSTLQTHMFALETQRHSLRVEEKKKTANTRLIRRLMMDSAAKTLSPTAESSMVHHAPRLFLCFFYYFWLPLVLFGLFNSAHPIIRNLGRTSSRLFLLPGAAVGRTDRGGAHWLSCCYVLRISEWRGGVLCSGCCTGMSGTVD